MVARLWLLMLLAGSGASLSQIMPIHQVQGNGPRSPYEGQEVRVRGVVTGVTSRGFFVQELDPDQNPQTSEGLFVFTDFQPFPEMGDVLELQGTVQEYVPATSPSSPPLTELTGSTWQILQRGRELPSPVFLDPSFPRGDESGWDQLEALEGMRVALEELVVSGPTLGTLNETTAVSQSSGVFFGVAGKSPRPFREPGFPPFEAFVGQEVPRFDGNPQVLRVDTRCLVAGQPLDVAAGTVIRGLQGPLTFAFGRFTLCPEPGFSLAYETPEPPLPGPVPWGTAVVASWNLQRFYDDQDDPQEQEPVLTPEAWARRKAKFVQAAVEWLQLPHVLVLQELENGPALEELATAVNQGALERWGFNPAYISYLQAGPGSGPHLGMLVATAPRAGVQAQVVEEGSQILKDERLANPDGSSSPLFDRPPLTCLLVFRAPRRAPLPLKLVGVHLRSMRGLLSQEPGAQGWATEGERVRAKRKRQAEALAQWIDSWQQQHPELPLVVLGDFNAFEFPDGVVDVVGTVAGTPAPASQVSLPTQDQVIRDLLVLTWEEPSFQRYSYVYDGSAQALDHVLVSSALTLLGVKWEVRRPRLAADWPESWRGIPGPWRLSDHDPVLLFLQLARAPVRVLRPAPGL